MDVLRTSQNHLPRTFLVRQIRTSPGRCFETSPGRQIRTSPGSQFGKSAGWSNRIFRGRPGDIGGDVLGTSWEPVFAFWVNEQLPIFLIQISVTESIPAGIAINLHSFL